ncbi:hypothetical protein KUCAC02_005482, partial [Chaenocephalus aceratus]
ASLCGALSFLCRFVSKTVSVLDCILDSDWLFITLVLGLSAMVTGDLSVVLNPSQHLCCPWFHHDSVSEQYSCPVVDRQQCIIACSQRGLSAARAAELRSEDVKCVQSVCPERTHTQPTVPTPAPQKEQSHTEVDQSALPSSISTSSPLYGFLHNPSSLLSDRSSNGSVKSHRTGRFFKGGQAWLISQLRLSSPGQLFSPPQPRERGSLGSFVGLNKCGTGRHKTADTPEHTWRSQAEKRGRESRCRWSRRANPREALTPHRDTGDIDRRKVRSGGEISSDPTPLIPNPGKARAHQDPEGVNEYKQPFIHHASAAPSGCSVPQTAVIPPVNGACIPPVGGGCTGARG